MLREEILLTAMASLFSGFGTVLARWRRYFQSRSDCAGNPYNTGNSKLILVSGISGNSGTSS